MFAPPCIAEKTCFKVFPVEMKNWCSIVWRNLVKLSVSAVFFNIPFDVCVFSLKLKAHFSLSDIEINSFAAGTDGTFMSSCLNFHSLLVLTYHYEVNNCTVSWIKNDTSSILICSLKALLSFCSSCCHWVFLLFNWKIKAQFRAQSKCISNLAK